MIKFPKTINLELTNKCNLKCQMCLNWTESFRKKGYMDDKLVQKIVNELIKNKKHIKAPINICGIGEPLLYDGVLDVIDKLYKAGLEVVISTNGILLLNRSTSIQLLKKCKKIMISLDTFSQESYLKIKGGDFFNIVLTNIRNLLFFKKVYKYDAIIQINMLNIQSSFKEIKDCLIYFGPFLNEGDLIYTRNVKDLGLFSKDGNTNDNLLDLQTFILKNNKYHDKIVIENWKEWVNLNPNAARYPCRHLWFYCMILYNGDVTVCCMDFNGKFVLGNVNRQSIKKIWNGENYNIFRDEIVNNFLKDKELCVNCEDWYKCW